MNCKYCKDTKKVLKHFFSNSREMIDCTECQSHDIDISSSCYGIYIYCSKFSYARKNTLKQIAKEILYECDLESASIIVTFLNSKQKHNFNKSIYIGGAGPFDFHYNSGYVYVVEDQHICKYKIDDVMTLLPSIKPIIEIHKKLGNI